MEPLSELDHFWYYSLEAMEKSYWGHEHWSALQPAG